MEEKNLDMPSGTFTKSKNIQTLFDKMYDRRLWKFINLFSTNYNNAASTPLG